MACVKLGLHNVRVSNIFCVGRNYAAHAAELGHQVESEPLVFLKPTSALIDESAELRLPAHSREVHYECELVLLIGKGGEDIAEQDALQHVAGYGIALDMTARDVQDEARRKGHPWTRAKGFRRSACVSALVPAAQVADPQALQFSLHVNGELRQQGDTALMLFPVAAIISHLSHLYGLSDGDLIFTGTPAGVAAVQPGDRLELALQDLVSARWDVV